MFYAKFFWKKNYYSWVSFLFSYKCSCLFFYHFLQFEMWFAWKTRHSILQVNCCCYKTLSSIESDFSLRRLCYQLRATFIACGDMRICKKSTKPGFYVILDPWHRLDQKSLTPKKGVDCQKLKYQAETRKTFFPSSTLLSEWCFFEISSGPTLISESPKLLKQE